MDVKKCQKCGSVHILVGSGICVKCGHHNKPRIDQEEEKRKAEEAIKRAEAEEEKKRKEARRQKKEELLGLINSAGSKMAAGNSSEAGHMLRDNERVILGFGDDELTVSLQKLQAEFFKSQGVASKYLDILKVLVPRLPFNEENYEYFYALGVAFQKKGNAAAARKIFDHFVNSFVLDYKDVKERYDQTTAVAAAAGPGISGGIRVRAGAFELEAESIRKWINAASSANKYFSEAILLTNDREHLITIDDLTAPGEISLENVLKRVKGLLKGPMSKLVPTRENITLYRGDTDVGEEIECIVFSATKGGRALQRGTAGTVRIGARLVGVDRVTIVLYVIYQPRSPEEVEDISPLDFNEAVRKAVQLLHPVENDHELVTLVEALERTVINAVRSELMTMGRGTQAF